MERRVPTCLDVAFAALGNDQVVPELVARMTDIKLTELNLSLLLVTISPVLKWGLSANPCANTWFER